MNHLLNSYSKYLHDQLDISCYSRTFVVRNELIAAKAGVTKWSITLIVLLVVLLSIDLFSWAYSLQLLSLRKTST